MALLAEDMPEEVKIRLPAGMDATIPVHRLTRSEETAVASVIKDAGDDPDVTDGIEIVACAGMERPEGRVAFCFNLGKVKVTLLAGRGIGVVTKKGLPVPPSQPAINPVPRRMIEEAVREAIPSDATFKDLYVTLSVPEGEKVAERTMNPRLGIMGGISILGTTGVVVPFSVSAYRVSIKCAMDVAEGSGCKELVLSTGRMSEEVARKTFHLPAEAFILVGDHMGYALRVLPASVESVIIAGQFGKMSKLAMDRFATHYSQSSIDLDWIASLAEREGLDGGAIREANTAREAFSILEGLGAEGVIRGICEMVRRNVRRRTGRKAVRVLLAGYNGRVVEIL